MTMRVGGPFGSGSFGSLTSANEWTAGQTFDNGMTLGNTTGIGANFWLQALGGSSGGAWAGDKKWELGIDTANHGGGVDFFLAKTTWRTLTDLATTSAATLVTSASAAFGTKDPGKTISGTGIPGGTTIASIPSTTIAAGSDATALPQATITVASTAAFATAGTITVVTDLGTQTVTYTGTTGTTFTGCTGGTGTMNTGNVVSTNTQATLSAAATATATGVTAQVGTTNAVDDTVFLNHNGGDPGTIGLGVTPPGVDYRVYISPDDTKTGMGGLSIRVGASQTGFPLALRGSSGKPIQWWSATGILQGDSSQMAGTNASLQVKGDKNGSNRVISMSPASGAAPSYGFEYNGNSMKFRNLTTAADLWQSDTTQFFCYKQFVAGAAFAHQGTTFGVFSATPVTKRTRVGAVTDSSGGTSGGGTIAAAGATYDQTNENNFRATVAALITKVDNVLSSAAGGYGFTA